MIVDQSSICQQSGNIIMNENTLNCLMALLSCNSKLIKKLEQNLSSLHGLGLNEFFTLYHLSQTSQPISRITLAEALALTPSGVTRLLIPMDKLGYVTKQKNKRDARLSLIELTKVGKQRFQESNITYQSTAEGLFENLLEKDKENLLNIIAKIH